MKFDLDQWMKTWGLDRKSAATVLGMSKSGFQRALSRSGKAGSDTSKAVAAVEGLVRQLSGMDKEAIAIAVEMADRQRQSQLDMRDPAGANKEGVAMLAVAASMCGKDVEPMPMLLKMGSIDGFRQAVKDVLNKEVGEFWATAAAEAVAKAMDLMQPELDRMTGEGWTPKAEAIFDLFDWPQVYKDLGFDDGSIANVQNIIATSKDSILSQMRGYLRSRYLTSRALEVVNLAEEKERLAGWAVKKPSAGRVDGFLNERKEDHIAQRIARLGRVLH